MKKIILIAILLVCGGLVSAQTFSPKVVKRSTDKIFKDSTLSSFEIAPEFDYSAPLTLSTPALQLTFTRVEKVDGSWKLTTPIIIGYSYIFSYANGIIHRDSSITVENHFFFGGGLNVGLTPKPDGSLETSVPVGAIIGYSRYGLFGGIDILTAKPIFGVSINLLNVPILQSLTRLNIKSY